MEFSVLGFAYGLVKVFGSVCIFLYGMKIMSEGIQRTAGERLQNILKLITGNRFSGVLTGFAITALIQSSSATTVMVVSFVNAGLLSLKQAIGVIMGANIGTTVTGWLVSILGFKVKIAALAIPVIGIGFPFMFSKRSRYRYIGEIMVGFGLLFIGLDFMKGSVPDIKNHPEYLQFLTIFTGKGMLSTLIFIAVGTFLTVVIQSSSAAMAVTLTMMASGWIEFPTAAALILGENIGTTITAYLASLGTNVNARRAARAHTLFNLFGVFWMVILFQPFIKLVDLVVPGPIAGDEATHLAMFHTMFNITNTFVLIWFVNGIAFLVKKFVKPKESDKKLTYQLQYIHSGFQETAEISIMKAKKELSRMAEITEQMFNDYMGALTHPNQHMDKYLSDSKELEEVTDKMQEEISKFLVECAKENLNEVSANNVNAMIRIVHEIESIGDSCFNLVILASRMYNKKLKFAPEAFEQIQAYAVNVTKFMEFTKSHLNEHLRRSELDQAYDLEKEIDTQRDQLRRSARQRLQSGGDVKTELLFIDMIKHLEHIGDYSLNIAQALRLIY